MRGCDYSVIALHLMTSNCLLTQHQWTTILCIKLCVYAFQREKEAYLLKIFELEKDLNQKQHAELEIAQLKGKLQVMKYIECGDESVVEEKLGKELEQLEKLRNALIKKERESNDELQQTRTVFIEVNTNDIFSFCFC